MIAAGRGRKPAIGHDVIEAIVWDTLHSVPDDGSACWSTRSLAAVHGEGKDTVAKIWKARNLRPCQRAIRFVTRDGAGQYTRAFDDVFAAIGADVITTPPGAP